MDSLPSAMERKTLPDAESEASDPQPSSSINHSSPSSSSAKTRAGMTVDPIWDALYDWLKVLYPKLRRLSPIVSPPAPDHDPNLRELGNFRDQIYGFERAVTFVSQICWETQSVLFMSESLEPLFKDLQAVEKLYQAWLPMNYSLNQLVSAHRSVISGGGQACYSLVRQPIHARQLVLVYQLTRSLGTCIKSAIQYQTCLRDQVNILSRPRLRRLTVLDLPTELLLEIFEYVRGDLHKRVKCPFHEYCYGVKFVNRQATMDIQNCRLTCWRFCDLTTHLLMDRAFLQLQTYSVARFQEMSAHPVIGQKIRAVEVCLGVYHQALAENFRTFVAVWARRLRRLSWLLVHNPRAAAENYRSMISQSQGVVSNMVVRISNTLQAWQVFASTGTYDPEDMPYITSLQDTYEIYRKLYLDQKKVLEDGTLPDTVARALARMPGSGQAVMFTDSACNCRQKERELWLEAVMDDPTRIAASLLDTTTGMEVELLDHRIDPTPPVNLMVDILAAWPQDGILPTKLKISFGAIDNTALLVPKAQAVERIRRVARRLDDVFVGIAKQTLRMIGPPTEARYLEKARNVYQFLEILLDTDTIAHLVVNLAGVGTESPTAPSIGPILLGRNRPKLWGIQIFGATITGDELMQVNNILVTSPKGRITVALDTIYLSDGVWRQAVEALQAKVKGFLVFHHVGGGEALYMDKVEFARIFGRNLVPC